MIGEWYMLYRLKMSIYMKIGNQPWIFIRMTDAESWSSKTLATWFEQLTQWKRPRCWERLKAKWEGGSKGWDGYIASPTLMDMNLSKLWETVEDRGKNIFTFMKKQNSCKVLYAIRKIIIASNIWRKQV